MKEIKVADFKAVPNTMKIRILVLIIVALLLFSEVFLRLFISQPSTQQFDDELGYTNIPGSQMIESQEGYGFITFNSLGFNDYDPNNHFSRKIFIIGDSYTEALQLDNEFSYTTLLEKHLESQKIDIIKLARDSFVPLHYPIVSNRYFNKYQPELTIIQFGSHTLSDLYGDNITIKYTADNKIESYTLHISDGDRKKEAIRGIINNSALAYYLLRRYKYLIINTLDRFEQLFSSSTSIKSNKESHKEQRSRDDYVNRLVYVLKRIKGKVLVLYLPDPGILLGSDKENTEIRKVIESAASIAGTGFIDLSDDIKRDFIKNNHILNGFSNSKPGAGHLNKYGHSVVANSLLIKLKSNGYLN